MPRIRMLLFAALIALPLTAQGPIFDPAAYAPYENLAISLRQAIRQNFGIHATGSNYSTRKLIADSMDQLMGWQVDSTGQTLYHPFLYPEIACFSRAFLIESLEEMIAEMDADAAAPQAVGVKAWYTSENGVLFQVMLPTGPGGSLRPFRVMYDFTDLFVDLSGAVGPGCIAQSEWNTVVSQIAQRIDLMCISHIHPDHTSATLVGAMHLLNKPILVPASILYVAMNAGFNVSNFYVVPQGVWTLSPYITLSVFNGNQIIYWTNGNPPDYVENKVHIFSFNVPVDGSPNDGVTVTHFGDNSDPALTPFLNGLVAQGVIKPHVVTANGLAATTTWATDVRIASPLWEITHVAGPGSQMNMPYEGLIVPSQWMPLFWGESIHYPLDFPL